MDPRPNAAGVFNKYASQYQDKFMDVSRYHQSLDLFCQHLTRPNANILEIACGPGNITRYLINKLPHLKILGIDLAPNMIELAKSNNPTANFKVMDARNIGQPDEKYHAIMCGFCLPYLSKEETLALMQNATNLLYPGGLLYLSTMEDDYSRSGIRKGSQGDEIYMYYHEADTLIDALQQNKFEVLHQERLRYTEHDGTETTDLVLIAKK